MKVNRSICNQCQLCENSGPLVDSCTYADVMVVGLSAKVKKYEDEIPLDRRTRSGKVIEAFKDLSMQYGLSIYRTNIVKCAPLDDEKKLRYPHNAEIDYCFKYFEEEVKIIRPQTIILLGDIVRKAVMRNWGINISSADDERISITQFEGMSIVAMYHPSYVLRSKERKESYNKLLNQILVFTKEKK